MKEETYKIKYAPLKIKRKKSSDYFPIQNNEVFAYIAAPAYLMSEKKIYLPNNEVKYEYEVVFINEIDQNYILKRNKPNYQNNSNFSKVEFIDDDLEKVKQYCNNKNIIDCYSNICNEISYPDYQNNVENYYKALGIKSTSREYLNYNNLKEVTLSEKIKLMKDFKDYIKDNKLDANLLEEAKKTCCNNCENTSCNTALYYDCYEIALYIMKNKNKVKVRKESK